jgi:hypothetical protein
VKYICLDCNELFDEPLYWQERHGFDYGPFEQWSGCPYCRGSYVEAYQCDACGDWIDGEYIKLDNGDRICEHCYTICEIGDED